MSHGQCIRYGKIYFDGNRAYLGNEAAKAGVLQPSVGTSWDDKPIFQESIEAWANGPVVRRLYEAHKGKFIVNAGDFPDADPCRLSEEHKETIDTIISAYGKKSAQWLSDQTHSERPWLEARRGLDDSERGNSVITLEAMAEYYSSLR